jgi:opacity protein-like surface antigen
MRKAILGAASALAFASPAAAADLVVPRYSEAPSYQYRAAPPVVIEEPAPVIVAPPPAYAYAPPVWREGWRHRGYFHGRW